MSRDYGAIMVPPKQYQKTSWSYTAAAKPSSEANSKRNIGSEQKIQQHGETFLGRLAFSATVYQ